MDIKEQMSMLKMALQTVEEFSAELLSQGVELNFDISSNKKTVNVSASTLFQITVKGTINQEL